MKIILKKIDIDNKNEITHYVKWENDLDFYHLIAPMRSKDSKVEFISINSTQNFFNKNRAYDVSQAPLYQYTQSKINKVKGGVNDTIDFKIIERN